MTLVKTAETNEGIQDKLTEEERKKLQDIHSKRKKRRKKKVTCFRGRSVCRGQRRGLKAGGDR